MDYAIHIALSVGIALRHARTEQNKLPLKIVSIISFIAQAIRIKTIKSSDRYLLNIAWKIIYMINNRALDIQELSQNTTAQLKQKLLQLASKRNFQPLKQKVQFYQEHLEPIVTELAQRNPHPQAEDQLDCILGVWQPVWSTIPFQDILPGRIAKQSYQIFHNDGFYANIARYAPGSKLKLGWLQRLTSVLLAFDLAIVQKYRVHNGQWQIENVGIKQAIRWQGNALTIDRADSWFTKIVQSDRTATTEMVDLKNLNTSTSKKLKTAFGATPQFEHLYIDRDFRIIKTRREAKQRPSYTIAIRIGNC